MTSSYCWVPTSGPSAQEVIGCPHSPEHHLWPLHTPAALGPSSSSRASYNPPPAFLILDNALAVTALSWERVGGEEATCTQYSPWKDQNHIPPSLSSARQKPQLLFYEMPPSPFHALPKPRAVAAILSTSTCGHRETYTRAVVDDQAPPAAFLFTP